MPRRKTPAAVNRLRGYPGKRKPSDNEPTSVKTPKGGETPIPPLYIKNNPRALVYWGAIVALLLDVGLVNQLDSLIISNLVWNTIMLEDERAAMGKESTLLKSKRGSPTTNPRLRIIERLAKMQADAIQRLGLSPADRQKLTVMLADKDPATLQPPNEIETLMLKFGWDPAKVLNPKARARNAASNADLLRARSGKEKRPSVSTESDNENHSLEN